MTPSLRAHMVERIAATPGIRDLPVDARGYPIPFVVMRAKDGTPDFIVNDSAVLHRCAEEGLCSVCGGRLREDGVWFIGGPLSAYDPRGAYNDGPVHRGCGEFALTFCPYLGLPSYRGMSDDTRLKRMTKVMADGRATGFIDPTVIPTRPKFFVLSRATGFDTVEGQNRHVHYYPNRPWAEAEEWAPGGTPVVLSRSDIAGRLHRAEVAMNCTGVALFQLPPAFVARWNDKGNGRFPFDGRVEA
jgi:hypothetical protein